VLGRVWGQRYLGFLAQEAALEQRVYLHDTVGKIIIYKSLRKHENLKGFCKKSHRDINGSHHRCVSRSHFNSGLACLFGIVIGYCSVELMKIVFLRFIDSWFESWLELVKGSLLSPNISMLSLSPSSRDAEIQTTHPIQDTYIFYLGSARRISWCKSTDFGTEIRRHTSWNHISAVGNGMKLRKRRSLP